MLKAETETETETECFLLLLPVLIILIFHFVNENLFYSHYINCYCFIADSKKETESKTELLLLQKLPRGFEPGHPALSSLLIELRLDEVLLMHAVFYLNAG
jgi:hypothetical protein